MRTNTTVIPVHEDDEGIKIKLIYKQMNMLRNFVLSIFTQSLKNLTA